MKQHYTDNDIENLLTSVSRDVFSVREEHFKKILSSLDLDSSLEKSALQRSNTFRSPYMFMQTNMYKFAGAMAVFVVALFGAVSYTKTGTPNLTNIPLAQNTIEHSQQSGSGVATGNSNTSEQALLAKAPNNTDSVSSGRMMMASKSVTSPESHAINTSVATLQTAEESAADDLLALNEF